MKILNFYFTGEEKYAPAVISGPKNCGDVTTEAPDPNNIRIMSYNMYGWNANQNPYKKDNMYKIIRAFNPDTLGVQESFNDEEISENIGFGTDYRYLYMYYICTYHKIYHGIKLLLFSRSLKYFSHS